MNDLIALYHKMFPPERAKRDPGFHSPPAHEYADLAKYLWDTVTSTPKNLKKAFTYPNTAPVQGGDPMSRITTTATTGARGVRELLQQLGELGR